jgi:hypothetical protein
VARKAPGALVIEVNTDGVIELYLRENEFGMRKYSRHISFDARLGVWERGSALLACFMIRIDRSDLTTFSYWVNPGDPAGVRFLKCLAPQHHFDLHFCLPDIARTIRFKNTLGKEAQELLFELQSRPNWSPEEYERERGRMDRLYPRASELWWECVPAQH